MQDTKGKQEQEWSLRIRAKSTGLPRIVKGEDHQSNKEKVNAFHYIVAIIKSVIETKLELLKLSSYALSIHSSGTAIEPYKHELVNSRTQSIIFRVLSNGETEA